MTEDDKKDFMGRAGLTLVAMGLVLEAVAGKRGVAGTIECPACKGELKYSVARSNGHTMGACQTEGCIKWIQ